MEKEIKELRVKIDGLAQLTKSLKPIEDWKDGANGLFEEVYNSKEIEKAVDSLYLAKAWLGKLLSHLGRSTPYTNDGKRSNIKDIESATDVNKNIHGYNLDVVHFEGKNHIERVDCLREEINNTLKQYETIWFNEFGYLHGLLYEVVYKYLSEARFWLGFELARVKEEK